VSSADRRDDVERQAGRVAQEAGDRGITLDATVTEVGSGVTGNRATLRKILADPQVSGIVVEHRDRLARFGVEHLEAAAVAATGRRIIVVNPG
jgi:putative resolvase